MFMDDILPDTVASLRRSEEIRTLLLVMALLARVHPCVGMTGPRSLRLTISTARNGTEFTLSCAMSPHMDLWTTKWYRNSVHIFDATDDDTLSPLTTSPVYQSVSGRISVISSPQQHNVTLRTNSTLDQGSVWRCDTGQKFSNNITIEVKESIRGPSSTHDKNMMTMNQTVTTQTQFISVVAGSAGGVVIVVVIVIVVLLCIRSRREGKCQTNDKTEKDNCKEGGHNEESEKETVDVYAKVNKVRKTHNATEVQITLSIEDLYAKPNKPASGNSEGTTKVSSNQNADVNTPD